MLEHDQAKQQPEPDQAQPSTEGEVEAELTDEELRDTAGGFSNLGVGI